MRFHSNQLSWSIKHHFISVCSKYQSSGFIRFATILAPDILSLDKIYCRILLQFIDFNHFFTFQGGIQGYPSRLRVGRGSDKGHWSIWAGALSSTRLKRVYLFVCSIPDWPFFVCVFLHFLFVCLPFCLFVRLFVLFCFLFWLSVYSSFIFSFFSFVHLLVYS